MAFSSVKNLVATVADASPAQFDDWRKSWRAATDAGSTETLLTFVARERGVGEDAFIQKLAAALGWPYLDLAKLVVEDEVRNKLSTKIAFQFSVLPAARKIETRSWWKVCCAPRPRPRAWRDPNMASRARRRASG